MAQGAAPDSIEAFPRRVGAVQDTQPGAPGRSPPTGYWRPLLETFGLNAFVWSFNRFIKQAEWAKVTPETWWYNLNNGWNFDDNAFQANQIAHPYHGGLFFASARASGYGYWASAPTAFFGSFMWEYFAETYQPSFNDWLNTSIGGLAVGESLWRFSEALLDDRATGMNRFWREFGATALSPMRGFNRLIAGEMWHTNPEYIPIRPPVHTEITLGARTVGAADDYSDPSVGAMLRFRLDYGNDLRPFDGRPFDAFMMRFQVNTGDAQNLGLLEINGRLWADREERKGFTIRQWFIYNNYNAYVLGAQSVGFDWDWLLGSEASRVRLTAGPVVTLLGAVSAENVLLPPLDEGYRDYDYGPGGGVRLGVDWRKPSSFRLRGGYFLTYLHSVNGSSGEHILQRADAELNVPVWHGLGANVGATWLDRHSFYDLDGDETVRFSDLELRLGVGVDF